MDLDSWRAISAIHDRHHVESAPLRRSETPAPEILLRDSRDPPLLLPRHGFFGRAEAGTAPALDLHEAEHPGIHGNEVDLPRKAAIVPLADEVARGHEALFGEPLPSLSDAPAPAIAARKDG